MSASTIFHATLAELRANPSLVAKYPAILSPILFEINPRLSTTVGRANYPLWRIQLSAALEATQDTEMIRNVSLHEIAHLLSYSLHGHKGRGHGKYWRQAMRDVGHPNPNEVYTTQEERQAIRPHRATRRYTRHEHKCPNCHTVFQVTKAKSERIERSSTAHCSACGPTNGLLSPCLRRVVITK